MLGPLQTVLPSALTTGRALHARLGGEVGGENQPLQGLNGSWDCTAARSRLLKSWASFSGDSVSSWVVVVVVEGGGPDGCAVEEWEPSPCAVWATHHCDTGAHVSRDAGEG